MPVRMQTLYPKRGTMWGDEFTVLVGASLGTNTTSSNQWYNTYSYVNSAANGNSAGCGFYCQAGTYTFTTVNLRAANQAIVDLYIDGVIYENQYDCYTAASTFNSQKITTGVVLAAGYHTWKWVVNGRNASNTTGWYFQLTKVSFKPASD